MMTIVVSALVQTKKYVGANEFELLFEEVFNLLRPTLYPRE